MDCRSSRVSAASRRLTSTCSRRAHSPARSSTAEGRRRRCNTKTALAAACSCCGPGSVDPHMISETELVFAISSVAGSTAACATHGNIAALAMSSKYYELGFSLTKKAGGKVVKVLGDGMLMSFPVDRAKEAVAVLKELQNQGTEMWQAYDARCRVQVKASYGRLLVTKVGPPGDERDDLFGHALNMLFKLPAQ